MIDWIERLPDSMIGLFVSCAIWFGFNYAVLAERAMAKDQARPLMPHCLAVLQEQDNSLLPAPLGLGRMLGIPLIDQLENAVGAHQAARMMSTAEKEQRCACAIRAAARSVRFDYAVHTSTFRLVSPQSLAGLGSATLGHLSSGVCGGLSRLGRMG